MYENLFDFQYQRGRENSYYLDMIIITDFKLHVPHFFKKAIVQTKKFDVPVIPQGTVCPSVEEKKGNPAEDGEIAHVVINV